MMVTVKDHYMESGGGEQAHFRSFFSFLFSF